MSDLQTLQRIAGEGLINQLTDAVSGYQATGNFSCSSSVDIDMRGTIRYLDFTSTKTSITSPPVVIHWDALGGDMSSKITFSDGQEKTLQQLKGLEVRIYSTRRFTRGANWK